MEIDDCLPPLLECLTCRGLAGWGIGYDYTLEEYAEWEDCPDCEGTGSVLGD